MPTKKTAKTKNARKRARNAQQEAPSESGGGWGAAGDEAKAEMERARAEAAANRGGFQPLRFFLKKGSEERIIILDDDLHSFMGNEHHLKHSNGKWGNFQSCCNQFADCPICENYPDHPSYRVLMLSVLVQRPWTDRKGTEHAYSRMLLPIKQGQHERFIEIERIAKNNNPSGTLRGVELRMKRGEDKQSINIGEPTAMDDGSLLDYWSEDDLLENFGHDAVENRDGEVVVEENGYLQPFDYLEIFPKPDPEEMRKRFGDGSVKAGSSEDHDDAFGDDHSEEEEGGGDDIPMVHSFTDKGKACDEGVQDDDTLADYEDELVKCAEKHELDYNDFPTWEELGVELDSKEAKPKTRAKKKTAKKQARKRARNRSGKEPFD